MKREEILVPEGTAEALKPAAVATTDLAAAGTALAVAAAASLAAPAAGAAPDMLRPTDAAALAVYRPKYCGGGRVV